jgi:hypothetical protein
MSPSRFLANQPTTPNDGRGSRGLRDEQAFGTDR